MKTLKQIFDNNSLPPLEHIEYIGSNPNEKVTDYEGLKDILEEWLTQEYSQNTTEFLANKHVSTNDLIKNDIQNKLFTKLLEAIKC